MKIVMKSTLWRKGKRCKVCSAERKDITTPPPLYVKGEQKVVSSFVADLN